MLEASAWKTRWIEKYGGKGQILDKDIMITRKVEGK